MRSTPNFYDIEHMNTKAFDCYPNNDSQAEALSLTLSLKPLSTLTLSLSKH
jgi:hypothetical protein